LLRAVRRPDLGAGLARISSSAVFIKRRVRIHAKFPDAIELLVRGCARVLPISETISVSATSSTEPVGEESGTVADKMKIGRTMDAALQDTADRMGTPNSGYACQLGAALWSMQGDAAFNPARRRSV